MDRLVQRCGCDRSRAPGQPFPPGAPALPVSCSDSSTSSPATKRWHHLQNTARAGFNHTKLLVLACGGEQAAVSIEGHAEDDVGVTVNHFHWLAYVQVPDEDLEGRRAGGQVSGCGVLGACPPSTPTTLGGAVCTRSGLCWATGSMSRVLYRKADASQLHTYVHTDYHLDRS